MQNSAVLFSTVALLAARSAQAAGDLSRANPEEIAIEMGTSGDRIYFSPDYLDLETGKAYKIVLRNVDEVKHEFAEHELIERMFTRKVEISDEAGELVAEIKGNVREIEVDPMREVEWFVAPVQTGEDLPMLCEIEGHKEAGMFGAVTIH